MSSRTSTEDHVEWPHSLVSTDVADQDLGAPLKQLLIDLGIKGTDDDQGKAGNASTALTGTPASLWILESGATAAAKGWAAALAALGGGTVLSARLTLFWNETAGAHDQIILSAGIFIAACALAIGLIMYADLRARGQGAAAQYHARAAIAVAFLTTAPAAVRAANPPTAPTTAPSSSGPPEPAVEWFETLSETHRRYAHQIAGEPGNGTK